MKITMTVQQIVPYAKYVTNGADSVYTVNFFIEDKENLFIKLNDVVVSMNDYNYLKDVNGIEFHTPLLANQKLEIFRKTKLERTTNFESFNNTFRPEALNNDLDKIWLNLQEQSHKVDQYDLDYTYSVSTANQALKEAKDAQARADDAYELADLTNTETRPINRGGTGAASSEAARTNLNVHSKEEVVSLIQSGGSGTIVAVNGGGTGADNIADARTNLDVYSKEEINDRVMSFPTTGSNTWNGSQKVNGDLKIYGEIYHKGTQYLTKSRWKSYMDSRVFGTTYLNNTPYEKEVNVKSALGTSFLPSLKVTFTDLVTNESIVVYFGCSSNWSGGIYCAECFTVPPYTSYKAEVVRADTTTSIVTLNVLEWWERDYVA